MPCSRPFSDHARGGADVVEISKKEHIQLVYMFLYEKKVGGCGVSELGLGGEPSTRVPPPFIAQLRLGARISGIILQQRSISNGAGWDTWDQKWGSKVGQVPSCQDATIRSSVAFVGA